MSNGKTSGPKPEQGSGGDGASGDSTSGGSGGSGEGADSAFEAMLKKRQMRINPPPAGPPAAGTPQQDPKSGK